MNMPMVSALVTVFNRQGILGETVSSLLRSSYRDFELLLVDDHSSDASWDVCNRLASNHSCIRIYRNETNLGDYPNRNRAASLATGKYLKYLDADDLIYRHSLAVMVEAMEQFPEAALALSHNVIDPEVPYPRLYTPEQFFREHYCGRSPVGVGPSAAIIRRDCFEEVGGFSGRQFVGDTELWIRLAERWPIVALPPALVWWRRHPGQQMQIELKRPEMLNIRMQLELDALHQTAHLNADEKVTIADRIRRNHARRLMSYGIRFRRPLAAWQLLRAAKLSIRSIAGGLSGYR